MVKGVPADDMLPANFKIKAKISHDISQCYLLNSPNFNAFGKQGIKIIQTFVTEKIILSMAASVYKWFLVPGFLLLVSWFETENPSIPANAVSHPYYISVVEINHNSTDKALEVSCKIFTNDFETTLEKNYKTKVDLVNPKDKPATEKLIVDYINKHLLIKADGKAVKLSFIGYEKEEEAIYSYFQVDNVPSVKKIDVANSLLHDFSNQQINIIHCIVGGKRQSSKLDYPNTLASFQF